MRAGRKTSEATVQDYKRRMTRVLVHIQQHLDDPLRLEDLATVACFSPYHFHRIFKGMIGESLHEHVRRLRLERAAIQLRLGGASVIQIALSAGYETHESFTRAFKAAFGMAPSRFRSLKRRRGAVAIPSGVRYAQGGSIRDFKMAQEAVRTMDVKIQKRASVRVAFLRHVGPYDGVGAVWDKLLPWLGKEGYLGGDASFIGICHDDPEVTPPQKLRYDACVTVDKSFLPKAELGVQTIPGGPYAVTTHFGPYPTLGDTYAKLLGQWLPSAGRELRPAPCFEVYLNSPEDTEPGDLLTDIYAPLLPSGGGATKANQP